MEHNAIKQLLKENLERPEKDRFNKQILQQLKIEERKSLKRVFTEKDILYWFLFIAAFVLFFYLQQASKWDANAILIGSVVSAIPLYLLLFNKIYSPK